MAFIATNIVDGVGKPIFPFIRFDMTNKVDFKYLLPREVNLRARTTRIELYCIIIFIRRYCVTSSANNEFMLQIIVSGNGSYRQKMIFRFGWAHRNQETIKPSIRKYIRSFLKTHSATVFYALFELLTARSVLLDRQTSRLGYYQFPLFFCLLKKILLKTFENKSVLSRTYKPNRNVFAFDFDYRRLIMPALFRPRIIDPEYYDSDFQIGYRA